MNVVSLFSGIGGLDLGIKLAIPGARVIAYVERDAFCQRIIRARIADDWLDDAPIFDDVRTFPPTGWNERVDVVIGGWPCQPFSLAGKRAGRSDERHLWPEVARIVGICRPRYVFGENVPGFISLGLGECLADLAALGFDAEWTTLRASDVGAPQQRERIFILAYATNAGREAERLFAEPSAPRRTRTNRCGRSVAHADSQRLEKQQYAAIAGYTERPSWRGESMVDSPLLGRREGWTASSVDRRGHAAAEPDGAMADATSERLQEGGTRRRREERPHVVGDLLADTTCHLRGTSWDGERDASDRTGDLPLFPPGPADADGWRAILDRWSDLAPAIESSLRRVADGTASRVDRLRALGNAVVPLQAATALRILARRLVDG